MQCLITALTRSLMEKLRKKNKQQKKQKQKKQKQQKQKQKCKTFTAQIYFVHTIQQIAIFLNETR